MAEPAARAGSDGAWRRWSPSSRPTTSPWSSSRSRRCGPTRASPRRVFDDEAHRAPRRLGRAPTASCSRSSSATPATATRSSPASGAGGRPSWRACARSRRSCGPRTSASSLILALAENVAREDLNAVDQARAYAVLADELDLSQTEIARRVGKSRPAVANTMRLLELPDDVLDLSRRGRSRRATAVRCCRPPGRTSGSRWPGPRSRAGWSVRDLEVAAKRAGRPKPAEARRRGAMDDELAHLVVDAAWQSLALRPACAAARRGGAGRDPLHDRRRARPHRRPAARRTRLLGRLSAPRRDARPLACGRAVARDILRPRAISSVG